jgi:uncharacterized protein YchJ
MGAEIMKTHTSTKNQHYIPQSVIANFANNKGQVHECLLKKNKRLYVTNNRQSMSERYTYEHPDLPENHLENAFSKIESDFSPLIRDIRNHLENGEISLAKQIVESLITKFIVFYYRSGALLNEFSFNGTEDELKINLMLDKILNSNYINKLSQTLINNYQFAVIKSDEDFLMSDQYVSTAALSIKGRFTNLSNRHIGLKDVIILIPISSKFYVVYSNGKTPDYIKPEQINILNEQQVDVINSAIINNSYKKCLCLKREPIEKVIDCFRTDSPVRTIMIYKSGHQSGALTKKEVFYYKEDVDQWEFIAKNKYATHYKSKRNDLCKCDSGKKYKHCCLNKAETSVRIINDMHTKSHKRFLVSRTATIEKALDEYYILSDEKR